MNYVKNQVLKAEVEILKTFPMVTFDDRTIFDCNKIIITIIILISGNESFFLRRDFMLIKTEVVVYYGNPITRRVGTGGGSEIEFPRLSRFAKGKSSIWMYWGNPRLSSIRKKIGQEVIELKSLGVGV